MALESLNHTSVFSWTGMVYPSHFGPLFLPLIISFLEDVIDDVTDTIKVYNAYD